SSASRVVSTSLLSPHGPPLALSSFPTRRSSDLIPLTLGGVFVLLFAVANPVIAQWLDVFSFDGSASELTTARAIFWQLALSMIWPFVHLRWRQRVEQIERASGRERG